MYLAWQSMLYSIFIHQLLFVVPESQEWDTMFAEKVAEFDDACHRSGISEESKVSLVRDPTHHSKYQDCIVDS